MKKNEKRNTKDLRRSWASAVLIEGYRFRIFRQSCIFLAESFEGGVYFSATVRDILKIYHQVELGAYSYTPEIKALRSLRPNSNLTIGRYVSIGRRFRVFLENHPFERLSSHPFFYSKEFGYLKEDALDYSHKLAIGHDVWIGEDVIITPGCASIGTGAIVGAGSVVTKDVPDFAIVAGVPAKLLRYRFPEKTRALILQSRWWERSVAECARYINEMVTPLGEDPECHPLLAGPKMK